MTSGGRAPTLLDVVRVLSVTYQDEGVLIWLNSTNRWLSGRDGVPRSPSDLIALGRTGEVYEAACRIEGFDAAAEARAAWGER